MKITVEEVRAAYQKTGLTPARRITHDEKCACPIGVIGADKYGLSGNDTLDWSDNAFGILFTNGFICGFDGDEPEEKNALFLEGYENGKEVAKAIIEEDRD